MAAGGVVRTEKNTGDKIAGATSGSDRLLRCNVQPGASAGVSCDETFFRSDPPAYRAGVPGKPSDSLCVASFCAANSIDPARNTLTWLEPQDTLSS